MTSKFNRNDGLLARVNFPLYSLQMLTSRHVLVAGGGGSAKTGVANGFVSFVLITAFDDKFKMRLKLGIVGHGRLLDR